MLKSGKDIVGRFPGVQIIHQNIRDYRVESHRHEEHEFFLPLQGEIEIRIDGLSLKAKPGKMIYVPPNRDHSFSAAVRSEGERVILLVEKKAWKKYGGSDLPPSVASVSQLSKELLFHLLLHPLTKTAPALLETLAGTLSETFSEAAPAEFGSLSRLEARAQDEHVRRALVFISGNFRKEISVAQIARASRSSVRTQHRLFLLELGLSPIQVVTQYRIETARKLLRRPGSRVTEVAFAAGYGSVSRFIAAFRAITGNLPSEYQK